jgi:peptide/nickel transport system substrate-binding protein
VLGVFPQSASEVQDLEFNNDIFDGLTRVIGGQVKPALAESWTNPDKTTWRFYLRKGVKFHNGDSFTSADVKFSMDQALAKEWPDIDELSTIKSVDIIDNFTVDIKTVSPDPILASRLVLAFIVSEKQYKAKAADTPAVGTGPYKFVSLSKTEGVLQANTSYYLGAPRVKKVIYKFYPEETTDEELVAALRKGEVDLIALNTGKVSETLTSAFQVKSIARPMSNWLWLDAMRQKSPYVDKSPNPLTNKLVRQAIYKAIDFNQIVKEAGSALEPASQLVPETVFGYNPNIKRIKRSVAEARSLMKQAGVESGFTLTLDAPGTAVSTSAASVIASNLAEINITVKVNKIDKETGLKKLLSGDTSAFLLGNSADTLDSGDVLSSVLHTPNDTFGSGNILSYSNPSLDKLIEEATTTFESKSRLPKLQEAMTMAMEELPIIPLVDFRQVYVLSNNFDWTPTGSGTISCNEITGREVTAK